MYSVVQYNILNQKLGNSSYYPNTEHDIIDSSLRWDRLSNKIIKFLLDRKIVCLQELGREWKNKLQIVCSKHNYQIIHDPYGNFYTDYMGCAILVPSEFQILDINIKKISDYFFIKKNKTQSTDNGLWSSVTTYFYDSLFGSQYGQKNNGKFPIKDKYSDEEYASSRPNTSISVLLNIRSLGLDNQIKDGEVWVHTYHMPCAYNRPGTMNLHTIALLKHIQSVSSEKPYIIAADFNFKPDNLLYKLLTGDNILRSSEQGSIIQNKDLPIETQVLNTKFNNPLRIISSAAYECMGREPEVTCATQTKKEEVSDHKLDDPYISFQGCLDYIFYEKEKIEMLYIDQIKHDNVSFLPSKEEPSDHISLIATFLL